MQSELLSLLACPECKGELKLQIDSGDLEHVDSGSFCCTECSQAYRIEDDIPLFSPDPEHRGVGNQRSTYSTWWDRYHDESTITDESHRDLFAQSMGLGREQVEGRVILDGGCGNGRFSYVLSSYGPELLVAFDISSGVYHARRAITRDYPDANVAFVQGDITKPPFRDSAFDNVVSWGVIHHTPDAPKTFSSLSALVKRGGRMGIYVYEFHPLYSYERQGLALVAYLRSLFLIRPLRFVASRLPARVVHALFVPLYYLDRLTVVGVLGCHGPAEDKWNKEHYFRVVIDRFKTRYASEHQLEEVVSWFSDCDYRHVRLGGAPRLSLVGTKADAASPNSVTVEIAGPGEEGRSAGLEAS